MIRILLIFGLSICGLTIQAHDAKEAYFSIEETENSIVVHAEFPWTIRNALFKYNPELETTKDKGTIDASFFEYVKSSLLLVDRNQEVLQLKKVTELPNNGHSHQTNYVFEYEKGELLKISNTLMFNVNDDQKNYHIIVIDNDSVEYVTTNHQPEFYTTVKSASYRYWIITLFVLVGLIWGYRKWFKT